MIEVDDEYYKGFEGEIEIDFVYRRDGEVVKRMEIWFGYFLNLIIGMVPENEEPTGILYDLLIGEDWEEEPWKILDIQQTIEQFCGYNECNFNVTEKPSKGILLKLPKVLEKILNFLKEVKKNDGEVYIEYL